MNSRPERESGKLDWMNKQQVSSIVTVLGSVAFCLSIAACTGPRHAVSGDHDGETVVESKRAARQLTGERPLTLQWISWEKYGTATVKNRGGALTINGEQRSEANGDYLKINGDITRVEERRFFFDGVIEIRVSHINGGEPYLREGSQEFFR
ncbi:MAG: hypothetical protein AAGA58_12195 [Verrucomicrobiota bacterium]